MDSAEKARRCREFIDALDEERRKIQLFQRELPLCLHLLNQTIDSYKRMVIDVVTPPTDEPEFKEFISSRAPAIDVLDEENHAVQHEIRTRKRKEDELVAYEHSAISVDIREEQETAPEKGRDWMASTRIWSLQETAPLPRIDSPQKLIAANKNCGVDELVEHLDKERDAADELAETLDSWNDGNISGEGEEKCGSDTEDLQKKEAAGSNSNKRKTRRLWSEELHKRFVDAIRQLGGCHAATPKQIRQLMKVDGLTNDEIKSHLQKFRIHARGSSPTARGSKSNAQTAHFVLVGGIWIRPQDYAAALTGAATPVTAMYPSEVTQYSSTSGRDHTPIVSFPYVQVDQSRPEQSDERHAN